MPTREAAVVPHNHSDDRLAKGDPPVSEVTSDSRGLEASRGESGPPAPAVSTVPVPTSTLLPFYFPAAPESQRNTKPDTRKGWGVRLRSAMLPFGRLSSSAGQEDGIALPAPNPSSEPPPRYGRMTPRPISLIVPVSSPDGHPAESHIGVPPWPSSGGPAPGRNTSAHGIRSSGGNNTTTVEPPPAFGEKQSPEVVPKAFFFYGFIMPLFWLLGALVLTVKLRAIPPEACGKTVEEQADMLKLLRQAEEKWAYRCLGALVVFLLLAAVVSISVVVAKGLS